MKKIMIALTIVAMAAIAQAATIKWNSGTIYNQAGTKANASTALVNAYLYSLTAEQYATIGSMTADAIYAEASKGTYGDVTATAKSGGFGTANITQSVTGGNAESPVTYYGVVIYVDELSNADQVYVKATANTTTFQDDGTTTFSNLSTTAGNWTAAVPEPTSGLLLLLGIAGLALRRKNA